MVAGVQWDFHTRSDHLSTHPRCLPLAITRIALSQVCCCSLRALYWIVLITAPQRILVSAFGNKRGRKEWTAAEFPSLGRSKSPATKLHSPPLQIVPASGFARRPTTPQQHHHRSSRIISEMFETNAPAPVSCPRSMWVWITSNTCNDISYLSNIKSLAAEPSCVTVYCPIMSEHPENLLLSLDEGHRNDGDPCCMCLGKIASGSSAAVSSTPHSCWGENYNKWDPSLSVTISYYSSMAQGGCLSLKKCWKCGMWI